MEQYIGRTLQGHGKLTLSSEPLGKGGEGSVYAVQQHTVPGLADAADIVAKIYHDPTEGNRKNKTAAMLKNPPESDSVAWPLGIVFTADKQFAGYVMVKLDNKKYRQWSELANAADRRETSPHFDVQYGLTAAKNLAIAIDSIHEAGHRVGDVNESNIFVGTDATVLIVDTDSAQISSGERTYNCLVGKPDYTAPELIGGSLRDKERTRATDVFAYAIAIYQMLTGGFHPTDGVYQGDDMPPDFGKKIRMNSYPSLFGANQHFTPNPKAPADALPLAVRNAILDSLSANPDDRPSLAQFLQVLDTTLENLQQCDRESNHWYSNDLSMCPWCAHAEQTRVDPWAVAPIPVKPAAAQTALPSLSFEENEAPVKARRAPIQRQGQRSPQQGQSQFQGQQQSHSNYPPPQQYPGGQQGMPGQQPYPQGQQQPQQSFQQQQAQQNQPQQSTQQIPSKIKGKTVLRYADGSYGVRPKMSVLLRHNPKMAIHSLKTETPAPLRFWWSTDRNLPSSAGLTIGVVLHVLLSIFWFSVAEIGYGWLIDFTEWNPPAFVPDFVVPIITLLAVALSTIVVVTMFISGIMQLFKARKQGGGSIDMFAKYSFILTIMRYTPVTVFYGVPFVIIGSVGLILWLIGLLIQAIPTPRSMR